MIYNKNFKNTGFDSPNFVKWVSSILAICVRGYRVGPFTPASCPVPCYYLLALFLQLQNIIWHCNIFPASCHLGNHDFTLPFPASHRFLSPYLHVFKSPAPPPPPPLPPTHVHICASCVCKTVSTFPLVAGELLR